MNLEVIFLMKNKKESEKISIKRRQSIIFLMEKDSLANIEKKLLKNIDRYLKNISMHLKNLKKPFKKLQKYQNGLDYLFNEPCKTK